MLEKIALRVQDARYPEDIFGCDGSKAIKEFRSFVLEVHPDKHTGGDRELAVKTLERLVKLRKEAEQRISQGVYGDRTKKIKPVFVPKTVKVGDREWVLEEKLADGGTCTVYRTSEGHVFKAVRNGIDNDLLENESRVLKAVRAGVKMPHLAFFPELLEAFVVRSPGSQRRVHVMPYYGEHRSLKQVLEAYPDGVELVHVAWMFKRILHGVGFAHKQGFLHGALVPSHVLVHPVHHGAVLLDWSFAVDRNKSARIAGINAEYEDLYPSEVLHKRVPGTATDIYMAARCAQRLLGKSSAPRQVKEFFEVCTHEKMDWRPQKAWECHFQFEKMLRHTVGPRKYHRFEIS